MNYYENIVIIEPSLGEEELQEVSQKIKETIERYGGEILKEDNWGRRKLAYELNKRNQGYYILYTFKAPSDAVAKLESFYKVFEPVFKFMFIRMDKRQLKQLFDELKKPQETTEEAQQEA